MGARFESEVGEKCERLGAEVRRRHIVDRYRNATAQGQRQRRHRRALPEGRSANLATFHDRRQEIHDRFTEVAYRPARSYERFVTDSPSMRLSTMKKDQEIVRIEFTPEQKELVKKEIGKDADAVELTAHELEERIAPVYFQ
jgi:hypothetical protein